MRTIPCFSLLTAIVAAMNTPFAHAFQECCPWNTLSLSFEQYMCHSENTVCSGGDITDRSSSRKHDDFGHSKSSIWSSSSDCFEEYCVYTNDDFFGTGISLITTTTNYRRVKQIRVPEEPLISHHGKSRIVNIPGKGRGLVATRAIRRGEQIMTTRPALLVHRDTFGELPLQDVYHLMDMAINNLPKPRRESYLAQAGTMGGHRITDILFTNSFQVALGDSNGFHYGNFPEVSLLNHDCRPNLAFFIDQNLTHHTHAVRDVEAGEELTISYLDALQERDMRQERTRNSLGFSCGCPHCALPKKESDASDNRLRAILRLESELSDFGRKASSPTVIEDYVALYRKERLDHKMAGAYTLAALNYNLLGEATMAKKYARLSVSAGLLESGPDAADARDMEIIAASPESHWSWNMKPRR